MEPKTRMDNFFAKAAGSEYADDSMEPITDREYWINEMAAKIAQGGGGGGGGATIVEVEYERGEEEVALRKTIQMKASELFEAVISGPVVLVAEYADFDDPTIMINESLILTKAVKYSDGFYQFTTVDNSYEANSDNEYPYY